MGSLCLSSASILRCESYTRIQVVLLIVPTAIEVVFSTSLVFTNWNTGRRHLWLTAEGWIYFALALVDMLSHILPAERDDSIFIALDIFLAASSFLPILLYIIFLFLFTRAELINMLPLRFQTTAKLMLLLFIPAIVILNEVASFVGISRRTIRTGPIPVLTLGFNTEKDHFLWTFFTSLTLALITAYQAINFMFAFYRLTKAFLDQRRIETSSSDEARLFNGIGWIVGAFKMGTIETIVGFAGGGFGGAFTRRILRFLARAFLCIGLVKGVDSAEDFRQARHEMAPGNRKKFRQSRLREFISNPRLSTFRQLSPTATAFHSIPRAPNGLVDFSPGARAPGGLPGMKQFASIKDNLEKPRRRVIVQYEEGAPTLHMRFSKLDLPSTPLDPAPRSSFYHLSSYYAPSQNAPSILSSLEISSPVQVLTSPARMYEKPTKHSRAVSSNSTKSIAESYNSLKAVRELTAQFPALPPRAFDAGKQPMWGEKAAGLRGPTPSASHEVEENNALGLSHSSSLSKRKPVPALLPTPEGTPNPFGSNEELPTMVPITIPLGQSIRTLRDPNVYRKRSRSRQAPHVQPVSVPAIDDEYVELGTALDTGLSREFIRNSKGVMRPAGWMDSKAVRSIDATVMVERYKGGARTSSNTTPQPESMNEPPGGQSLDTLAVPWLELPEMEEQEQRLMKARTKTAQVTRIKSVGSAPRRSTPIPVRARYARSSLHIVPIMIPPKQADTTQIIQGSWGSTSSVLRDSEVLGIEDTNYIQSVQKRSYI